MMELQQCAEENPLKLANREDLFRLSHFLDSQPPEYYGIQMLVRAALLTGDPLYRIYFRRKRDDLVVSSLLIEEDGYSVIVGSRMIPLQDSYQRTSQVYTRKCCHLTSWALDYNLLPKAFSDIDEIDWLNDGFFTHYPTYTPHPVVTSFFNSKRTAGLGSEVVLPHFAFNRLILPVKDALNLQLSYSDSVYVKSLECFHAQLVYDHWSLKKFTTINNVALGIDQLPSAGVFLKMNDKIVSWVMCNPPGGISRLYTLENHRRKGYAKLAVQYLSKLMAQSGYVPFAHIFVDNKVSHKLFQSLGFELGSPCHDYLIPPNLSVLSQN